MINVSVHLFFLLFCTKGSMLFCSEPFTLKICWKLLHIDSRRSSTSLMFTAALYSIVCTECVCVCVCVCVLSCFSHVQLSNCMNCTLPDSSVHGILQARILEWVAMPSFKGSFQCRDGTHVSYVSCFGRWVVYH